MRVKFIDGPLDGRWGYAFGRLGGPMNPNANHINHLFTRGGVDHWYCQTGPREWTHFHTGCLPTDWDSRDKTPEVTR